jgi:hypothetical protein
MAAAGKAGASLAGSATGGFFLLASALWCLVAGKDLNFDFFNYHLYGPHLLLEGRFDRDYFGGGLAGYLNPLVHVPLYLMVRSEWQSLAIAGVLTFVHSLNLLLAWHLCDRLLPASQPSRRWYLFCGVLLAFLSPMFLVELGSSFAEVLTSIPVLAGLLLLLDEYSKDDWDGRRFAAAGLLLGFATGLKLANGLFAVGAVLALLPLAGRRRRFARCASALVLGALAGGLLAHGYWSYLLWREFGSPLFPMANDLFRAEDFPPVMFHDRRYLQGNFIDLLTLPFRMMEQRTTIYSEGVAPDIRPLIVFVLAAVSLPLRRVSWQRALAGTAPGVSRRLGYATAFFVACFVLWAVSSRIGRYAMPLWLLAGPLIAAWTARLFAAGPGLLALAAVGLAQGVQLYYAGNLRYSPARLDSQWLDVRVPETLRQSPHLFIVLGQQSWSAIIPYFHPDSSFSNVVGQYVMPGGERMPRRLRSLLDRFSGRTKVIFDFREGHLNRGVLAAGILMDANAVLSAYELQLESDRGCDVVQIRFDHIQNWAFSALHRAPEIAGSIPGNQLLVCGVRPGRSAVLAAKGDRETKRVDRAFAAVEKACPDQFSPSGVQTVRGRKGWERFYFNSVNRLMSDGNNVYLRPSTSLGAVHIGSLDQWLRDAPPHHCEGTIVNANPFIS